MSTEIIYNDLKKIFADKPYISVTRNNQTICIAVEYSRFQHLYPDMLRKNQKLYMHTITLHPDNTYTLLDFINGDKVKLIDRLKRQHIGDLYVEGYRYEDKSKKKLDAIRWNNKEIKEKVSRYLKDNEYQPHKERFNFFKSQKEKPAHQKRRLKFLNTTPRPQNKSQHVEPSDFDFNIDEYLYNYNPNDIIVGRVNRKRM